MGKKGRNGLEEMKKTEEMAEERDAAVQHTVKVRLMPPRGGADIRGRMSSSHVRSLPFSPSPSFLFSLI